MSGVKGYYGKKKKKKKSHTNKHNERASDLDWSHQRENRPRIESEHQQEDW